MDMVSIENVWAIQEYMHDIGLATPTDSVEVGTELRSKDHGLYVYAETPTTLYEVYFKKYITRDRVNHVMTVTYTVTEAVRVTDLSVIKKYLERKERKQ